MKKSILFSVLVVGATLLQAQSITVHQTCGQNGQVLVIETNGHECVDLGLPSGTLWATCNVGATTPEDYGNYYAWGETSTKETYNWSTYFDTNDGGSTFAKYNNEGGKTVLDQEDDAAHVNWGGSWRMPTQAEWQELLDNCTWTWTTQNGINGYKVTSNKAGYTDKFIFLPAAGCGSGLNYVYVGSYGYYRSSALSENHPDVARMLHFDSGNHGLGSFKRYHGLSVRPVLLPSSISYSLSVNDTIRIYSNGCDDYQTFIGSHGGQLTMTANSDQWSHFVRWQDGNTDNPRTITTNGNADYTAYFDAPNFSVQVKSNDAAKGSGYISKVVKGDTLEYSESVGSFEAGSEVFLAYQANYGYHFDKWSDGNTSQQRSFILTKDTTFTATFAKNVYSITKNAEHGSISGNSSAEYLDEVTLTVSSDYGYHFSKWSDGNTDNPRIFQITKDTAFTAEFAKNTYSVSTTSTNPEWGTTAGDTAALYLDEVEISAIPNYGYHFVKWDIEKSQEYIEYSTLHMVKFSVPNTWSNPYAWIWKTGEYGHWETLSYEDSMYVYRTVQNNMNIIVVPNGPDWGSGQTYDLDITGSCCYTISDEYDVYNRYETIKNYDCFSTDEQTIIAKLDTITYVDTTITTYTTNPLSLLVAQNQKAIAYFAKNIYSITKNAEHGSIDGNASAEYLDEVTMIAIPDYGYHFVQWSDGNTDNPRITQITQDTTFTSEFAKNTYSVSTTSTNPEWGTTAGDTAALYLDEVEISAIPNYGYHFVRWNDNNTSNPRTVSVTEDKTFTATFAKNVYSITKNAEHGTISGNSSAEYLDFVTLTVTPDYGYHFTQWSDGLKDNPRITQITKDTTFTAEFAYDRVGTCGKDFALVWSYDPTNKVLTIGNAGSFTENMQFGVEAPNEMEELVIGNSVTAIGANAFAGISSLKKVSIGESVKTIGEQAFYNCVNLETIFNYRPTPTNTYSNTFDGVDKFECELYVLPSSIDMYKAAAVWRDFYYTYAIGAEETTVTTDDVTVEPQNNAVTLTWPTDDNAVSYTIEITKDGVLFCTLIFNADGQLTGIAFAPSRNGSRNIPAATMTAKGLQFTVTGLNSNTQYGYSVTAKDSNEQDVATYSGEFTTTGEDEPTGIDNTSIESITTKLLRDGQIFILRGEKVYTLDGQLVR